MASDEKNNADPGSKDTGNLDSQLVQRLQAEQAKIAEVEQRLQAELARYGFDEQLAVLTGGLHNQQLRTDSFDGNQSLYAEWHNASGHCQGSLLIHGNGQVYAELDVLKDHPTNRKWFVESVTCWGLSGALNSELGLLPALVE